LQQLAQHPKGRQLFGLSAFFHATLNYTPSRYFCIPLLLISAFVAFLYSSVLDFPWVLDDQQNILDNKPIHLTELSLNTLKAASFANPTVPGTLYRPLASMSFALNWFFGQDNPFGYHVVNICIHILTGFFLYLVCKKILWLILPPDEFCRSGYAIALLTSLLWATNPVQTQAVTYIVQRMASLAALFSIIGILLFLKARTTDNTAKSISYGISTIAAFLCAIASKENAIVFPVSLLLIEWIFFKSKVSVIFSIKNLTPIRLILILATTGFLFLGVLYLLTPYINYDGRTFSLTERILTQPRVLIFYLSQLFFPLASRLSLEHDVILSSSLFAPWTTLPSILVCLALIFFGFLLRRKAPLLSLAILFFFVNHGVESSIIPLELIFEHRNYLPSFFIFLPIAAWCIHSIDYPVTPLQRPIFLLFTIGLLIFFGINTFMRNQAWSSTLVLMQDAHTKAPNSHRAATNLAKEYFQTRELDKALTLSEQAYHLWNPSKNFAEAISLNYQGVVHLRRGNEPQATQLLQQSVHLLPQYQEARRNLIISLCIQHRYKEALDLFFEKSGKEMIQDPLLQAAIQLRLNQPENAMTTLRSASRENFLAIEMMTGIGRTLSTMGHYRQAEFYLRQAADFSPIASLIQIENFLRDGEMEDAEAACRRMFVRYRAADIFNRLVKDEPAGLPIDRNLLKPFIVERIPKG
jgi:tetratricopeptide (TPR) repeat protein